VKPQTEEKSGYKAFLDNLSKEVKKIRDAEQTASDRGKAIDADVKPEFNDDGEPVGSSRPMLLADRLDGEEEC
jgi:hypothetical protein